MSKLTGSKKATQFTESVIREMTRLNDLHGGVNLSQGFPDFPAPQLIKDVACQAIQDDIFLDRQGIYEKFRRLSGWTKRFRFMNTPLYLQFLRGG